MRFASILQRYDITQRKIRIIVSRGLLRIFNAFYLARLQSVLRYLHIKVKIDFRADVFYRPVAVSGVTRVVCATAENRVEFVNGYTGKSFRPFKRPRSDEFVSRFG